MKFYLQSVRTLHVFISFFLFTTFAVDAQVNTWVEVNNGFAKCAPIGESAGPATWQRDDFVFRNTTHLKGEIYADIRYGTNAENKQSCAGGFFRYDTIATTWLKVAETPPSTLLTSNGSAIFSLSGGRIYQFTTSYSEAPTGWKEISNNVLKGSDVFSCACSPNNCWEGIQFKQPADAIGDTIYVLLEGGAPGCSNFNQVGKFSVRTGSWSFDRVGPLPHQMTTAYGSISDQHYEFVFADRIGGIFRYFVSYRYWGGDKCLPNYLWVYDPRKRRWENVSQGVNWRNMTGNSNPESCVNPNRPPIGWGPSGGWTASWDKRDIYASSETGIYRWEGDKFYYVADYWGNAGIYPTEKGIFTSPRGEIIKLNPATYVQVGQLYDYSCVHNGHRFLSTPDNGKTLYVVKDGMKDPQVCTWSGSASTQLGIYRLKFDPDVPSKARNLHVQTATYLGGPGDNLPVNTGVAGRHHVMVGGNFSEVKSPVSFAVKNFNGAGTSSRGRVLHLNMFGDTILSVTNLGNVIYDFEVQNFGNYRMVVAGDFGVSVLDSSSMNQLWNVPASQLWGSGPISVDIDDNGHVVVLRSKQFRVYNQSGAPISDLKVLTDDFVNDITIKNDSVYVTGFNNGTLDGYTCVPAEPTNGLPVQSAFVKAYSLAGGTLNYIFKTFGFPGSELGKDEADTRGYRINIGKDGKIYFLGEAAGGNSVFRWNGKQTVFTNGCQNPRSKLVSYDQYSIPFNTKSAHIAYFCTINPRTGEVERGQYVIPRLSSGVSNSYRIKDGYIHADQKGYVYIGGTSAAKFGGRDIQHLNGILVGEYAGGDMVALIVSPDYTVRTFWGTFSKEAGSGTIKGFGIRDNIISAVGETGKGTMITGSTSGGQFRPGVAINPTPFNTDMAGTNPLSDAYLAVWYQDVWRHAEKDTLEERKIPSNPVIGEKELNYRADFAASIRTVCVGQNLTFTNTSAGDSINHIWDFGEGASLPPNTFGPGPFTVAYSSPGLKTIQLNVLLKSKVNDYARKVDYVNVIEATATLSGISGPSVLCRGARAYYSVGVLQGASAYTWSVPAGASILNGQGSTKIEVVWGSSAGDVSVVASTPCGTTAAQVIAVQTIDGNEQSVLLVVGDDPLNSPDALVKSRIESAGYNVLVIRDENANEAQGGCAAMIVISASADPAKVGYKFLRAPVPVVSWAVELFDELAMTNGLFGTDAGTEAGQSLIVNSVPHELSDGLTGNVPVYTAAGVIHWGKPSPEGVSVATVSSGKAGVIGYEQGSVLFGLKAPARRVAFYSSPGGLQMLTTEGQKLFDQAICWAMYNCASNVTIDVDPLSKSVWCPGESIGIPFTVTGTFNAGSIIPPVQEIIMDDKGEGSAMLGHWTTTTAVSGFFGEAFRQHDNATGDSRFAKYSPELLYTGTYKVSINFPRDPSFGQNVTVRIVHAGGTDTRVIDQRNGAGYIDLGTYPFQKGNSGYVMITTAGSSGFVVADVARFQSVDLVPLGGNVFTAQLSGSDGSFVSPYVLGTLEGTTAGTVQGVIPANILPGSGYKVRIVSSNPSYRSLPCVTTLTVGSRPAAPLSISGNVLACAGETIQDYAVASVEGATAYVWDIPLGTSIQGFPNQTLVTTGPAITMNFGTATSSVIRVFSANACGQSDTPARLEVELTSLPPAKPSGISGKQSICPGALGEVYVVSPVPFASSYSWTLSSGLTGSSTTNTIVVDFTNSAGTLTVRAAGACGIGEPVTLSVAVNAACQNANAEFTGPSQACTGLPVQFSDASTGAVEWSWDFGEDAVPRTISGSAPANKPPAVVYSTPGPKTISLTINRGTPFENTETRTAYLNVSPRAVLPGIISGEAISCGTGSVNYSVPVVDHATTYQWVLPPGAVGTSTSNSIQVNMATAQSGFISVAGVNGCGAGPASEYFVLINNTIEKPGPLTGPVQICQGAQDVAFAVSPVAGATGYIWQLNGAPLAATTTTAQVNFATAGPATISVKSTNGCKESDPVTLALSVNPGSGALPGMIDGPETVCTGSQASYTIPAVNGAASYFWTVPAGATGSSASNTIDITFGNNGTGVIQVSAMLACGATSALTLPVTVQEGASSPPEFVSAPLSVCPDGKGVLYQVASTTGSFLWSLPNGASGTSSGGSILVDFAGFTGGQIRVSGVYACGAGVPATVDVSALPASPALEPLTGKARICAGVTQELFSVPPLDGVTSYEWTLPAGAKGNSSTPQIYLDFSAVLPGQHILKVRGTTECGVTAFSDITLTVLSSQHTGVVSGEPMVCPGETGKRFAVAGLEEALTWTWTIPAASAGASTTREILLDFGSGFSGGDVVALATMECGPPVISRFPVSVFPVPVLAGPVNGKAVVCRFSQETYLVNEAEHAVSYEWTVPAGVESRSATNLPQIQVKFGGESAGELCVVAKGRCDVSDPLCLPVTLNTDAKGECELFIPNAFSPNGDGTNEVWEISGLSRYRVVRVQVFNRWGDAVFDVPDYSVPWDGTVNGRKLPVGTYYYVITFENEEPRKGSVSIIRN